MKANNTEPTGVKTAEAFKKELTDNGMTISEWARNKGYTPREVMMVLNGFVKGKYGKSHQIAVAIGLKEQPKNHQQAA